MASTLVTLPNEILTQIVRYIDLNKVKRHERHYRRTICALTRTNRRLSNIARDELYRHIVFDIDEGHLTPWEPEPSFVRKFLRICRKRVDFLNSIRHMEIRWSLEIEEDDLLESLLRQLSKSTSLTHLRLDIPHIEFELTVDSCAIRPLVQRNQNFPCLQVLELIDCIEYLVTMPAEILYSLASLPSLQTLRVRCAISRPEDEAFSTLPQDTAFGKALDLKDQSFGLETLEIARNIHKDALALILMRCPRLKQLTALPGGLVEDEASDVFDDSYDDLTVGQLSPRKLTTSLLPIHTTLQSLKLSGKASRAILSGHPDHRLSDRSIIHLSRFKSLTHLEISVELLSQDSDETLDPDILRTMFPISLEHLEIHVEYSRGIFWAATGSCYFSQIGLPYFNTNPKTGADFTRAFTETLIHDSNRVRANLRWYLSLLSARKKSLSSPLPRGTSGFGHDTHPDSILPNLQSLRVVELPDRSDTWDSLDFVKSGYCPEVFWGLGVGFEVVLRVPKGWEVPKG